MNVDLTPVDTLADAVARLGADSDLIVLTSGQRWRADADPAILVVESGSIEWSLDVSMGDGGDAIFRRFFVAGGGPGAIAIGTALPHAVLTMVALDDSRCRLITPAQLRRLSGSDPEALAAALDVWIMALANVAAGNLVDAVPGTVGEAFAFQAGDRLIVERQVAWLPAGLIGTLLDDEVLPADAPVPLTNQAWVSFAAPAAGILGSTSGVLTGFDPLPGLLHLFRAISGRAERRAEEDEEASLVRVDSIHRSELDRVQSAIARFNGLLGQPPEEGSEFGAAAGAYAILDRLGVTTRIVSLHHGEPVLDTAKRAISAAGLRWREVTLVPGWWRDGGESMVVVSADERTTHGVLPRLRGGFMVHDQVGMPARRLNEIEAISFGPIGLAIHAPMEGARWSPSRLIAHSLRATRLPIFIFLIYVLISGLTSIFTPLMTGWIMNPIVPLADRRSLVVATGLMLAAGGIGALVQTAQSMFILRIEGLLDNRAQSAVWDRLLRLPAPFFRKFSVGDLANRSTAINQMRALLSSSTLAAITHSVSGLLSLGLMFIYSWDLALAGLFVALIYVGSIYLLRRRIVLANRAMLALTGDLQALVLQIVIGINRVRLSGAQSRAFALWAELYGKLMTQTVRQSDLTNITGAIGKAMSAIPLASIILVLGLESGVLFALFETPQGWSDITASALISAFPPSAFVTFNAAFGQFIGSLTGLTGAALSLVQIGPLYDRMAPIVTEQLEDERSDQGETLVGPLVGRVELASVCFRYAPHLPPVLTDVSFSVEPGQFVAVVGPSGAGKSSIVRLLLGFARPDSGTVLYDGRDLASLPVREVRRNLGVVLQDGRVMSGSLLHNIAMGTPITDDEAWHAAEQAGIADDIRQMPMGMETFVNDGAVVLSGGQRQRLMIARALVRRPRLLIMDEATSALDNQTQAKISKAIEDMNITRIVIAHRLSTIVNADKIIVLSAGRVVEQGTSEELMKLDGVFAALARRQMQS